MFSGVLVSAVVAALVAPLPGTPSVIPGVEVDSNNMHWVANIPQAGGSDLEFLERKEADGSLSRYAVTGNLAGGFQIIDITDPEAPSVAGAYVSPHGWQGDIQVNPRRNIVVFSTDLQGSVAQSGNMGIELVDISDVAAPEQLATLPISGGAHNSTLIDDDYLYASPSGSAMPHIVDYSDPTDPKDLGAHSAFCTAHDITLDPNKPDRAYLACPGNNWRILDVSDPANPAVVAAERETKIAIAHQIDPSPDSSLVVLSDEQEGGLTHTRCPGGGAHIYDISGKHTEGATETEPLKLGTWFPPFTGTSDDDNAGQWGNCTMHNMTFQAERYLMSVGWYTAGAWVVDMENPTLDSGGLYEEYSGTDPSVQGHTTWGNTQGHMILAGDEVWSTKWTRFDDPTFDEYLFNNGITRGFDVLHYAGPQPKKVSRLAVDDTASAGVVTGKLDRYAVWTYEGWVNKPLAGQAVTVTVDEAIVGDAVTDEDGTFTVALEDLEAGSYTVTATWDGDDDYRPNSVTHVVTAE